MSTLLIVSNALLWVVALALGVVTLALARQVGILYERVAPAGSRAAATAVKVGDKSPELSLRTLDGDVVDVGGARAEQLLVLFVSLTCPICSELLPEMNRMARPGLKLVLSGDGEEERYREYLAEKGVHDVPFVVSHDLGLAYQVAMLPFAVLLNPDGVIARMQTVDSVEQVERMVSATA